MRDALALLAVLSLTLAMPACGGGGSAASVGGSNGGPGPIPSAAPSQSPAAHGITMIADTTGRVGLFQEFDRLMTAAQITSDAPRYDAVWGANSPQLWLAAHPSIVTTRYFIPQEDRSILSGHTLAWWQSNHPDWILYACTASGSPTHDLAYWPGVGAPDVPLDMHNQGVIDYQVRALNGMNAIQNGDRALAIDQVIFQDEMIGGNPNFGQSVKSGEFACGVWQGATFVRRYASASDPAWAADMVAFVQGARRIVDNDPTLAPYHLKLIVNHPLGSMNNGNEQALLSSVDGMLDERGFADRGRYTSPGDASLFYQTASYMVALQKRGIAAFVINSFADTAVTSVQREFAVAAYFMANEGGEDLYISPGPGGNDHNYPEYSARLGTPCEDFKGGPHVYERRFSGGLVVLNAGSLPAPSVAATLPPNRTYSDVDGRKITSPLNVASSDGYVLTTTNGC